jgi:basic membrane protein A
MKYSKKLAALTLATLPVLGLLTACAGSSDGSSTDAASGNETFKVGFVTGQAIDNAEWLQSLVASLEDYDASHDDVEIKVVESTDVQEFEPKVRSLAEAGYDEIITMYGDMVQATESVAADYPDIMFGSLDGHIENLSDYKNIQEFGLDRLQTAYLAGVVAASETKSGVVGIVGGTDDPVILEIIAGWQQGLVSVKPDIKDYVVYAGSFTDPTAGKNQGLGLVDKGADVIGAAAGGSSVGTAQAAAQSDTLFVAWDTHYPEVFGDNPLELGSAVNDFGQMFISFIESSRDGDFKPGQRIEFGMDTGATSFDVAPDSPISAEAQSNLDQAMADIQAGKIQISKEMLHN